MPPKSEQKERTYEGILDSAAKVLRERGIAGARVAEVMKGAGLTVGGFYAHFASKEALVDEALRRTAAQLRGKLFAKLEERPIEERAELVLERYLSARHRDDLERGCPFPATVGEVSTTAPEHRAVLGEQVQALADELTAHLPSRPGVRGRDVALGLVALMYGGLSLSRALRGTALSDDVLRACRAIGRLALRGDDAPAE